MGVARGLALCAAALAVVSAAHGAAPPRPTGGLGFGPATLVDPLRSTASPVVRVAGPDIWVAGSRTLARSTDGGDSFRAVSPPVPAGSSDVVEAGGTLVVASADGTGVTVARSADRGATWTVVPVDGVGPATRPWLAADGATVFLSVTTPTGTQILSLTPSDGTFRDAGRAGDESPSTRCGRLVFDPLRRTLYLPCARGNAVELTSGRVEPGRSTGIVFQTSTAATAMTGPVGGPLPSVAVDAKGTPFVVWVDAGTGGLYAARPGFSAVLVNGAGADVAALPAAVGGAAGTFAVAFLGAETDRDPNTLPDPRSDPRGAAAVRWYGYTVLVRGLTSGAADVVQQRTNAKPVHFGRLCTTCAADPVLGDTLGAGLDPVTGALAIALPDASDPQHTPRALLVRQLAGPTPTGQTVARPAPANGVVDGVGDAAAPALDLTKVELRQSTPRALQVRMTVAGPAALVPSPGAPGGIWLARFQILSRGSAGDAAYRSLFAAAVAAAGAQPRFVAGEVRCADACGLAALRPATGRVEGNTVVVDVNLGALAAAVPLEGDRLYDVSAFTFAGDAAGNPVAVLDSLASFDYRLEGRIGSTTGRGRRITLRGAIRGAAMTVDVFENRSGRVTFRDRSARVVFRSTRITRVGVRGRVATITGTGLNGARRSSFVATVVDRGAGRRDSFALRLSTGYRRSGRLTSGNAQIRGTG